MTFRRLIFWLHLCAGCVAGAVVLMMSVTGVLLAFERQINMWADGHRVSVPATGSQRLTAEDLAVKLTGPSPISLLLRSDPDAPAEAGFGRERTVLLDPYTGAVLGEASKQSRAFFEVVERWHRTVGMQGENRQLGRAITGASNFAFFFLILSGPFLWWPREWTWARVKPVLLFRGGVSGRAREWNWHNVIGIWAAIPLFVIVLSGVVMSYPWANNLVYKITGNEPPAQRGGGPGGRGPRERGAQTADFGSLNEFWSKAEQQVPNWTSISLRLPGGPNAPLVFSIDTGNGGQPQKRSTLTFNRKSGETKWETFADNNAGRRLRTYLRFAHTGEVIGILGQIIAAIATAGAAFLVYTGIFMGIRRWARWRGRKRVQEPVREAQLT